ncbi:hypothetical protein H4R33_004800 [Dimargaris cristalligena]|uniref:Uncharacterized protein n=1 Tax=Dimargaris cristalligena TaxID=215637 RepID=A0A4P9ZUQ6_9FUNG|nr:hypothetical protein H4R33_004800 [Dimargaris cristalligena]RKP37287.1 hypothetical protein BJ085DRAFT_40821 [Dimargaris cristalligena]|eukprot:RKP37287.1 hypothetical protein BJ085DRAFT_40821 [Dimargaris cristalligena]
MTAGNPENLTKGATFDSYDPETYYITLLADKSIPLRIHINDIVWKTLTECVHEYFLPYPTSTAATFPEGRSAPGRRFPMSECVHQQLDNFAFNYAPNFESCPDHDCPVHGISTMMGMAAYNSLMEMTNFGGTPTASQWPYCAPTGNDVPAYPATAAENAYSPLPLLTNNQPSTVAASTMLTMPTEIHGQSIDQSWEKIMSTGPPVLSEKELETLMAATLPDGICGLPLDQLDVDGIDLEELRSLFGTLQTPDNQSQQNLD